MGLSFINLKKRISNLLVAVIFVSIQAGAALTPFVFAGTASAANEIDTSTHQGQLAPSGSYSSGNITTYAEGENINFRFTLTSSAAASGQMKVQFTVDDVCKFFDGSFVLGAITPVSGVTPTVTTVGAPVDAGQDHEQTLAVTFTGSGSAIVNYTLKLSNEAGECNGSSQHSRLANVSGDFKNIGAENVPVPAQNVIELPEIFVEKWVDTNADGVVDRRATAGEWSFSLDGGAAVPTDVNGKVAFINVTPNGNHTITESNGPAGQSFLSGSGTNCTFQGSTATANVQSGTTAQDATCIFNNGVRPGSITIVKNAIPNSAQDFAFTSSGNGVSNFSLDDDSDNTLPANKTFGNLTAGTYTFTEAQASGWYLDQIDCPNISETQNLANGTVSITIAAGQNITCTFTNRLLGNIVVTKQTDPNNDPTQFSIAASPANGVVGNANQTIADNESETYVVKHGTYGVTETIPQGWTETSNNCSGLVIDGNTPLVNGVPTRSCTINNTKLATINILKNALPNHDQDFSFLTTTLPGGNFLLDDDSGAADESNTLNSQKSFSDLTPNVAYSVTENSLPGWELTGLTCDTGNFTTLGSVLSVTPTAGQTINCTFTNTKYGIISGYKYEVNADGSSLGGLMNWTINLLLGGNAYATTTTDASGFYFFDSLLPDDYNVQEVNQAGYTQIYPNPNSIDVTLDAGEVSTDNNFGNFENGSIGGFKWNDLNGNGDYDNEPKLDEWTITLFNDGSDDDSDLDDVVSSDVTDSNGAYSFGNLAPGNYAVCETNKSGWVQTYPLDPNCHLITVDESGETNSEVNFGNQGRGTITVVKNVDTNNDGQVDQSNVTNWTWDIDGVGNFATGNTNTQQVAAGTYSVSEDQKTNFHFVSVDCGSDERIVQGESVDVTVSPGENVVCTFTNARDRGDITVLKNVDMNNDGVVSKEDGDIVGATDWTWDIDGDEFDEENIAMGSTRTVPTGNYTIKEDQKDNYEFVSVECSNDQEETVLLLNEFQLSALLDVNQAETIELQINRDDSITCTYTNRKLPTQLNLEKSNNRPNPTNTGDVVTYTLVVSVPEDHSALYDTVVQDLPPENFEYVDGSWTAYSSERGDIKNSPTTEPAYASPGQWNLGTMLAGEVVTLTYRAVISSIVSAGTYPDLAFAQGCGVNGATCDDAEIVYSNSNVTSDPFVGTQVTILAEDVVPATKTVLVNTGENHTALYAAIASILMLGAIIVARFQLPTKGGRK